MDNKTAITVALNNINSTIEVLRDNTEFNLIHSNLNTVKIVLENQLNDNHSDAYYDYTRNDPNRSNPFTKPEDIARANKVVGKENTYAVQEETTEGPPEVRHTPGPRDWPASVSLIIIIIINHHQSSSSVLRGSSP